MYLNLSSILMISAILVAGVADAAVPDWVHPGLTLTYDGISASVRDGLPVNGVQTVMTTTVNTVSESFVSGTTRVDIPNAPTYGWTYDWTTREGESWKDVHRFWVDPAHPTASVKGPGGEEFTVMGQAPYKLGNESWKATLMAYQSEEAEFHLTYATESGLVLAYAEKYPTQQVFLYLRSAEILDD